MDKKDDEDYNEGRAAALKAPKKYPAPKDKDIVSRVVAGGSRAFADYAADPLSRTLARTGLLKDKEGKTQSVKSIDGFISGRRENLGYKKGGSVKSSASKRGDGIAQKGKTRGKIC